MTTTLSPSCGLRSSEGDLNLLGGASTLSSGDVGIGIDRDDSLHCKAVSEFDALPRDSAVDHMAIGDHPVLVDEKAAAAESFLRGVDVSNPLRQV